jgi:hypothetical protein
MVEYLTRGLQNIGKFTAEYWRQVWTEVGRITVMRMEYSRRNGSRPDGRSIEYCTGKKVNIRKEDYSLRQNFSRLLTGAADADPFGSVSFSRIRIRDPFLSVIGSGSGSVSYSYEHHKINWKGKFNKKCLQSGSWQTCSTCMYTDSENQVKMSKKYCFGYITSLER